MFTNIITAARMTISQTAPETLTDAQVALLQRLMFECQFALQERELVNKQCELHEERTDAESDMHDALLAHAHGWHE